MNYEPRISDPRVYMRISTAMDWCLYNLNETKPKEWARVYLDRQLGHTHRPLGQWLRNKLLITQDTHYNMLTGKCKAYLLNAQGVKDICVLLGLPLPRRWTKFKKARVLKYSRAKFGEEIHSGLFEYTSSSNRQFNPIQNLPTNLRTQLFHEYGYTYNYDIRSAAPTLVYQYALQQNLKRPTPELDCYLNDPTEYRNSLATHIGCTPKQAKDLIIARFAGARFGRNNSLFATLEHKGILCERLKNNEKFERLTKDIKKCWDVIAQVKPKRKWCDVKDKWTMIPMTCWDKWQVYFLLEKEVMSVIQRELTKMKCRYFLEHDGWRCDKFVVPHDLELAVKTKTGFVIQLEWTKR